MKHHLLPVKSAGAVDRKLPERLFVFTEGDSHGYQQIVFVLVTELTQLLLQATSLEESLQGGNRL